MAPENEILIARLDERYKALDEKLDTILRSIKPMQDRIDIHQDKIHELDNWKSEVRGNWRATAIIGGVIGAVVSFIASVFLRGDK